MFGSIAAVCFVDNVAVIVRCVFTVGDIAVVAVVGVDILCVAVCGSVDGDVCGVRVVAHIASGVVYCCVYVGVVVAVVDYMVVCVIASASYNVAGVVGCGGWVRVGVAITSVGRGVVVCVADGWCVWL